ncbi:glutamate--cysteine ligase catalytic subunit-like isoform X1 [Varroa jacobsoni]|uniref:glutamate--cysteine ligase catalytic subunit-like isoform X1 n=1 Tax=Varroa jacobsoni TaxID=62625 RepID=UPI000BF8B40B|nr:glutamate--cysteine ligase catalytic subunit-like isoform X1 [Varroa jacobsoni]XP_022691081.1 glutamate--cysteine ligase catalytic subunit-like isoform X1 [Varroa jacobsoni]XP_022691082.1 glutamate--cysteine ligase catalytic subunit-like isoform X1 [Varroa jacobsoni]XP_022691083.1 glutamate--cysteine ligase catalytic subunit-like isoform X1 [Varroa jacobsoni]XP_022691084.1 glutamate--cysteine ligase catalytic subunit-like isoform X1 [Varroa jacobsoni]
MGLLSEGTPLTWKEVQKYCEHVRQHAIIQFINQYNRLKDRQNDCLKFGDEIEYILIKFDDEDKTAKLSLRANELLPVLQQEEKTNPTKCKSLWRPEFASYMIEGTPGQPYGSLLSHLNVVESNMRDRRKYVQRLLQANEHLMCLTTFPRLGRGTFTSPAFKPNWSTSYLQSISLPDEVVFQGHPRFKTLARNILERRGKKVAIHVPIFKDEKTPSPFIEEDFGDPDAKQAIKPDHIYMDAMGFGMGNCCLQVTFQACNISEARRLYDQLAPICPVVMALSAASPVFRGYLVDRDCRWNVIGDSVDCRRDDEKQRIKKSRYGTIDCYISDKGEHFNDIEVVYNKEYYDKLRANGVDHLLAQHISHLMIRDPLVIFEEKIDQDDARDTDHFENLQSTNWHNMRFKPPPPETSIGWRVEFRPMEIQTTEFENAAFTVFIVLLSRVIISYGLDFLVPISKLDENMEEAQKQDAARKSKFWFRQDVILEGFGLNGVHHEDGTTRDNLTPETARTNGHPTPCIVKMTADGIMNGTESFPGLIPLIKKYLKSMEVDVDTQCTIAHYLNLISKRAKGEFLTTATWIRQFILSHSDYKKDSKVSELITYDLTHRLVEIQEQKIDEPSLFGEWCSRSKSQVPRAVLRNQCC